MDRDTAEDHVVAPATNTTVPRNDDRSSTSHSNGNSVSNSPERGEGGSDDGFRERANPSPGRPFNAPDTPATTTETVSTTGERTSADEREVVPVEVTTPDTPRAVNEGATAASPRVDLNTTFEEIVRSADGEGSSDATLEMSIDARGNIREEGRAH
jgi:hypothetical protein